MGGNACVERRFDAFWLGFCVYPCLKFFMFLSLNVLNLAWE